MPPRGQALFKTSFMVLFKPPRAAVVSPTLANIWQMRYPGTNIESPRPRFILCLVSVECKLQGLRIRQPTPSSLLQLLYCVLLSFFQRKRNWFHLCGPGTRKRRREGASKLSGHFKGKDGGRGRGRGDHCHRPAAAAPVQSESNGNSNWRLRRN